MDLDQPIDDVQDDKEDIEMDAGSIATLTRSGGSSQKAAERLLLDLGRKIMGIVAALGG